MLLPVLRLTQPEMESHSDEERAAGLASLDADESLQSPYASKRCLTAISRVSWSSKGTIYRLRDFLA